LAVTEYIPPGKVRTLPDTVPLPRLPRFTPSEPAARRDTSPVGVPAPTPGATVTEAVTGCPCVRFVDESLSVVTVERKVMFCQFAARFAALTEPQPVAKSYPAVAGLPTCPGTLLFPTVMSLKMH